MPAAKLTNHRAKSILEVDFMTFRESLNKLNEKQREAVKEIYGPLLVVAGPGSGKTEMLSFRVANILKESDTAPANILCLTYTDAAALEMRKRLVLLIGREAYRVAIHTFHSLGVEIINRHPEFFYNAAVFAPADELTQLEVLTSVFDRLDFDDPLAKSHSDQGYTYLKPALKAIGHLKRAGLDAEEFHKILDVNGEILDKILPSVQAVFGDRLSRSVIPKIGSLTVSIESLKEEENFPVRHFEPINKTVALSLLRAVDKSRELNDSTKPLTEWKERWLMKNDDGERTFRDLLNLDRLRSLARIYGEYQTALADNGYYDFDDMLLDTLKTIERVDALRYELQEQYQFILIDEFQDTNDAQMRFIEAIAGSDVDQKPNLMAVGDDDQAIFKFQGAEGASNFSHFEKKYHPKVVVLTDNYRSTQEILDLAKKIRDQVDRQLKIKDVDKELVAANPAIVSGEIISREFVNEEREYAWIAKEIKRLIEAGKEPKGIAVISREHSLLQKIVPFLDAQKISIAYERQRNVLFEEPVRYLIALSRFLISILNKEVGTADELLPEILSFPFWSLDRQKIWAVALRARRENITWLEAMKKSGDQKLSNLADFFIGLGVEAAYAPAEKILDELIGSEISLVDDEESSEPSTRGRRPEPDKFPSPFKNYFFSSDELTRDPMSYLYFLSALKTLYQSLREHRHGELVKLADFVAFVDFHEKNGLPIMDQSVFAGAESAVNLMTAHKAKGQQFETVFVMGCKEDVWAKRPRGSMLPFPQNLPITPAGDNRDDELRLFYVAVTRAKSDIYFTSHETDARGRSTTRLGFLAEALPVTDSGSDKLSDEEIRQSAETAVFNFNRSPFSNDEKAMLRETLSRYKLSVTHLNNFLDVTQGGPRSFLERNLLLFPQAKSPAAVFGTAIHKAIELSYVFLKRENRLPTTDQINHWFESTLKVGRLGEKDFNDRLNKGLGVLADYFESRKKQFDPAHIITVKFESQGAMVGNAPLTGEIDKLVKDGSEMVVYDFKTGKPPKDWLGRDAYEKAKLHKYKNQLGFYKLLIENSREFGEKFEVRKGVLDFIEATDQNNFELTLQMTPEFIDRLSRLVQAIYLKISNLDFPDVSEYSPTLDGIIQFESDLLKQT